MTLLRLSMRELLMANRLFVIIVLLLWSQFSNAEELCKPDLSKLPKPQYFSNIYADAVSLGSYIKVNNVEDTVVTEVNGKFRSFTRKVHRQAISKLSHLPLKELRSQLDAFVSLSDKGVDTNNLPTFSLSTDPLSPNSYIYGFTNDTNNQGVFDSRNPQCNPSDSRLPNCIDGLNSLAAAIEPYKAAYVHCSALDTAQGAARLTANWQHYLDIARSQTFTDMLMTTWLEEKHLTNDHLVGPMDRQWFFMHPGLVLENVNEAPDGSNMEIAIAVEWFGVNWWNKKTSPIGYPFGVSLTTLYSDRPDVDDVGHGLMFHLDNKYSIGWADHGGKDSFFITIDILELFKDKKAQWKTYETKINEYTSMVKNNGKN